MCYTFRDLYAPRREKKKKNELCFHDQHTFAHHVSEIICTGICRTCVLQPSTLDRGEGAGSWQALPSHQKNDQPPRAIHRGLPSLRARSDMTPAQRPCHFFRGRLVRCRLRARRPGRARAPAARQAIPATSAQRHRKNLCEVDGQASLAASRDAFREGHLNYRPS